MKAPSPQESGKQFSPIKNKSDMVDKIAQLEDECLALEREGEDLEIQVEETIKKHEEIREKEIAAHQKWVCIA